MFSSLPVTMCFAVLLFNGVKVSLSLVSNILTSGFDASTSARLPDGVNGRACYSNTNDCQPFGDLFFVSYTKFLILLQDSLLSLAFFCTFLYHVSMSVS